MNRPALNRWLTLIHRYNGWNTFFLLISGLILYLPQLRAVTAPFRVPLKWAHIGSGVLMIVLLLSYLPLTLGHWSRLGRRLGQRLNVILLVAVTTGWAVSGIILWLHRSFPPRWASVALDWHNGLTWLVIPWLLIHTATRYFKLKFPLPSWLTGAPAALRPAPVFNSERRALLGQAVTLLGMGFLAYKGWGAFQRAAARAREAAMDGSALTSIPVQNYFDITHPRIGEVPVPPSPGWPAPAAALSSDLFPQGQPPHTDGEPPIPIPMHLPLTGGGRRGRFRIYTVTATMPAFLPDRWRFFAQGLVDKPLQLTWRDFLHLPRVEQVSDFHCVTGWSVYNTTWEGVRLRDVLDMLGVRPEADHVKFYSLDGVYTDDLPLDVARDDDILLAYLMDGQLLPSQHGGPVRLLVPQMYAYKSVKWLGGFELIQGPHVGYWQERGYPRNAWIKS
jgi:methionine sulfoxide reductase catalytic subunit